MFDPTKPTKTRRGDEVTIICHAGRMPFPIIGYIGDDNHVEQWTKQGWRYINGRTNRSDLDLLNV
jgi:hypothetical protein